jgi:hypothetical protein
MTSRAKDYMSKIWESRNTGSDTEEKLVSTILKLLPEHVPTYNAQNGLVVISLSDVMQLCEEIESI